jgi:hypothetical protein
MFLFSNWAQKSDQSLHSTVWDSSSFVALNRINQPVVTSLPKYISEECSGFHCLPGWKLGSLYFIWQENVEHEVLTVMVMKRSILPDKMPRSPLHLPMFQRNMSSPSSGLKNHTSNNPSQQILKFKEAVVRRETALMQCTWWPFFDSFQCKYAYSATPASCQCQWERK